MHDGNARRTGVILGVAAAGLLLGHWLTYLLDVPSHARDQVLQATGHGYLTTAGRMAAVTAAASLAIVFLGRLTRREPGAPFIAIAGRLAAVQISAFVAMEVLERLSAGATMHDLTTILPVGVAAQAVVALAGAWLLQLVLRAADVAGSLARSLPAILPRAERILAAVFAPPRELWLQRRASRAPPLPSMS
jgi:hypothetical protein